MRIGIDARLLIHRRGMGNFVYNLLMELAKLPGDEQYILYVDDRRAAEHAPRDSRFVVKLLSPKLYPLWEQISLPLAIKRDRLDALHCPANTAPLCLPKHLKLVLTIHDVMFLLPKTFLPQSPSLYQRIGRMYYRLVAPQAAKKATCIMTVSKHSMRDIADKLNIPNEKIRVIYESGNVQCCRLPDSSSVVDVKQRYAIDGQFILALGALDPRKNTLGVLRSFTHLKKLTPLPIRLVVAGLSREAKNQFQTFVSEMSLDGQVILLGFITEQDLVALYHGADVFLYPSLYEGFGMPVLEAMVCGTPVITTSAGSIPEVAGDATLFVDPKNPEEIAHAILQIISDTELRNRMIGKGLEQAKQFSWAKTAKQMLEIYRMSVKQ
ncbi:MAG: glycosyltransferase family 4 protein [Thermoleophilia bacterium]